MILNLERLPEWFGAFPEIILLAFALGVILLDLVIERKGILAVVSVIGLVITGVFSISYWNVDMSFFNGMLVVDRMAVFFQVLFLGIAVFVILASTGYDQKFSRFRGEYYALILLATTGMMFMAATADLIAIYISLELTSISLYVLVGFLKDRQSTEASLKYLLLGAVASAVLLYGMAMVFGLTGSTHLGGIAGNIALIPSPLVQNAPALLLGIVLLIAGFGFKIAAVPFQMWVPDVYEGAPTTITAYLSVASKAAGFALIVRVFATAFGAPAFLGQNWGTVFAVLAVITMVVGNVTAIPQANIKRMLGYSSIAQAGYLMVGLAALGYASASSMASQSGIFFFLASYTLTNLGAFIGIIVISSHLNSDAINDYAGLGKRAPLLALAMTLALISLIGMPPASGFMAKFYIFSAAADNGLLWLVIIAAINSVISAFYYLRVVKVMWFEKSDNVNKVPSAVAPRVALLLCSIGILVLGIIPGTVMRLAELAGSLFSF